MPFLHRLDIIIRKSDGHAQKRYGQERKNKIPRAGPLGRVEEQRRRHDSGRHHQPAHHRRALFLLVRRTQFINCLSEMELFQELNQFRPCKQRDGQ